MNTNRLYLNDNWIFFKKWSDALTGASDKSGIQVRLPHAIREIPLHYFNDNAGEALCGYQQWLSIPRDWEGQSLLLTFEGVAYHYKVFVNGLQVADEKLGFTKITIDITDAVSFGSDNLISVRVDSRRSSVLPYLGEEWNELLMGGIYRDVYLDIKLPVHLTDVFYQPTLFEAPKTKGMSLERLKSVQMTGNILSHIALSQTGRERLAQRRLVICQFLDGKQIANQPLPESGQTATLARDIHLWDTASPVCYEMRTELRLDGETVDVHTDRIGFRHIRWQMGGFYLNGRRLPIRGLCRSQTYPYVGYAMPGSLQREDARILKQELGCNAVRAAHYPQSHHFLDSCDELGLLVFPEIPGIGQIEDAVAKEALLKMTHQMIVEQRNHPSVVLWGVRLAHFNDALFYDKTNKLARKLDPSRPTGGSRTDLSTPLAEDVFSFEDSTYDGKKPILRQKSKVTPDMAKPYLLWSYAGHNCPAPPFHSEQEGVAQLLLHAKVLNAIEARKEYLGGFGDSFCDFPACTPYGEEDGMHYHGVMDAFRNPKPAAYIYASAPAKGKTLYVAGDFFSQGQIFDEGRESYILSNAEKVRMYRGEALIREYTSKQSSYSHMRHGPILIRDYIGKEVTWADFSPSARRTLKRYLNQMKNQGKKASFRGRASSKRLKKRLSLDEHDIERLYRKYMTLRGGEDVLRFEAINNNKVESVIIKARPTSVHLATTTSHTVLDETTGYDVAAVRVRAVDEHDNLMTHFGESLRVETSGCIRVAGPKVIALSGGQAAIYVKSMGETGLGSIRIFAENVPMVTLRFEVKRGESDE